MTLHLRKLDYSHAPWRLVQVVAASPAHRALLAPQGRHVRETPLGLTLELRQAGLWYARKRDGLATLAALQALHGLPGVPVDWERPWVDWPATDTAALCEAIGTLPEVRHADGWLAQQHAQSVQHNK